MYIMVRQIDNVVVGSAINPININDASANGCVIYEIDDSEFTPELLGSTLDYFDMVEKD